MHRMLKAEYEQLKKPPINKDVEKYLFSWLDFSQRAEAQPSTESFLASDDLCWAIGAIYPNMASERISMKSLLMTSERISMKPSPTTDDDIIQEVSFWREILCRQRITRFGKKASKAALAAACMGRCARK